MNEIEERPAIDLIDFCFLTAGAACPPLLLLAVGQWVLRRNRNAVQWLEGRATRLMDERLGLPVPAPTPLALPAPAQSPESTTDLLPLLTGSIHLLVVGHTGGGKSVLLHAVARELATSASVLVCDPDSIAGAYPGYRCVGAGDDYAAIAAAFSLVSKEVAKRRQARKDGQRTFPAVWVLVDEAHDVVDEIDGAWAILEDIIRRGRKLNMHAAICTQDRQVKTLGLEGKSKLLDNLTRVDVMKRGDRRVAVIDRIEYHVPALPAVDDTVKPSQTDDAVFGSLMRQTDETAKPVYAVSNRFSKPPETTSETDLETAIREMIGAGSSKNKVATWLKQRHGIGNKAKAYEIINAALGSTAPIDSDDDDDPPEAFRGLLG